MPRRATPQDQFQLPWHIGSIQVETKSCAWIALQSINLKSQKDQAVRQAWLFW